MQHYIGIDLGKQSSYFVVKNAKNKILRQMKVVNDPTAIGQALQPFLGTPCLAVIEATCNYYWMYQQLAGLGCQVKLAHPLKTKAIASAKIKNQCHALLTKLNLRPTDDFSHLFGLKGRQWLQNIKLADVFEFQKQQLLEQIEYYNHLLEKTDWQIEKMLRDFPEAQRLMEIPGIGKFGAALILAEIGPIERFPSPKQLVGYSGMAPGLYESGQTSHGRGITHEGNKFLRWILCELTHRHIRNPGPLRDFYLRLKPAKGHGKALVATARKFLVQIYFVLKDQLDKPVSVPGLA